MHAVAGAGEELGLGERPQHSSEFRTGDACLLRAGIVGIKQRIDIDVEDITAPAGRRAEPRRPMHCIVSVDADAAFAHTVEADWGNERALIRVAQSKVDAIVSRLDAYRYLARKFEQAALLQARSIGSRDDPIVVLMELVAIGRIAQEVRKIVKQIQFALDDKGVGLPYAIGI